MSSVTLGILKIGYVFFHFMRTISLPSYYKDPPQHLHTPTHTHTHLKPEKGRKIVYLNGL